MAIAKAGIRRIALWDKANTEAGIIVLTMRQAGKLTITDKEDIKDFRNRVLPDMINFKIEAVSYDIGRPLLYYLLVHAKADGVSTEVITRKISTGVYDGIFSFAGDNFLGLDFEYTMSQKERSAKIMLEATYERDIALAILNDAYGNNTPNDLNGFDEVSFLTDYYRPAYFSYCKYGSSDTVLFTKDQIVSRKLTVKSKGNKTVYDRTIVNMLDVLFEVELAKSEIGDIKTFFESIPVAPKLSLQEKDPAGKSELHVFKEGVLSLSRETNIADDSRTIKLKFQGDVPIDCVSGTDNSGSLTYNYTL